MKPILKVIKYVAIAILIIIALILISVIIQAIVNPNKVPSIFGYKPFIVLSGSMESELYKGDLAIVKNVDTNTLKINDIVAFREYGEDGYYVVTHRIVKVIENNENKEFITKGDNNNSEDVGTVSLDRIEGLYVHKISGFGNVLLVMQKPLTLGIALLIIALLGILWIMKDKNKLSKDEREELELLRKEKQQNT